MAVKRRKTNPSAPAPTSAPAQPTGAVTISTSTDASTSFSDASQLLAEALLTACLADDFEGAKVLVGQGADAWVQDGQGWTALHAAAGNGNTELVTYLLRNGNAVWNVVDNLGCTAGDIAFSLNEAETYDELLAEGVRAEMLRAAMEAAASPGYDDEDADENEDAKDGEGDGEAEVPTASKLSTASDNATFLASRLTFTTDAAGQEICVDAEGNGVMMGWERGIMSDTARLLCEPFEERLGRAVQDSEEELNVVNVGFGLGIIDTFLQAYAPTTHLIIEPHPDVLASARAKGWYDKPGVRIYEGTWQAYVHDLEEGKEEYLAFDAVYFAFILASGARASIYVTSPSSSTTAKGGKPLKISWLSDSLPTPPLAADFGQTQVDLMTGSTLWQTVVQACGIVDPVRLHSLGCKIDAKAGPNSNAYFLRFQSVSQTAGGFPLQAFSSRFTLTSMTGTFSTEEQQQVSALVAAAVLASSAPPASPSGALSNSSSPSSSNSTISAPSSLASVGATSSSLNATISTLSSGLHGNSTSSGPASTSTSKTSGVGIVRPALLSASAVTLAWLLLWVTA